MQESKARLTFLCQSILKRYDIGSRVEEDDEFSFLLDLFQQHPDWDKKQGIGVRAISIGQSDFRTRCFVLHRFDGTTTDISYVKCLTKRTPEQIIRQACRTLIRPQVYAFRNAHVQFGITRCAITGEILTKDNTHIDHYDLTFDEMFKLWFKDKNVDAVYASLAPPGDNEYGRKFQDPEIIKEFVDFHDQHCQLRAVTQHANLSILRKAG